MNNFQYYQPTQILFGSGWVNDVGSAVARFGKRCLIVSGPSDSSLKGVYQIIKNSLEKARVESVHFDEVLPNPTIACADRGSALARKEKTDVVLGVGGGSSMDTAKAIAVGATHEGSVWDYLFFRETQPTEKTLPVVAVTTTSGTGSQVTQASVITESRSRTKSALFHPLLYPKVAVVDPEFMVTVPHHVTASTGFDAFCHAFEAYLHPASSAYTNLLALQAIRIIIANLPRVLAKADDLEARSNLAWADTLAGLCIANAGVTLPHGIGMTIGGVCPQVMHGEALAVTYPEFTRFTCGSAPEKFAKVGTFFNSELAREPVSRAAERSCDELDSFLKEIGMWLSLESLGVPESEIPYIADHSRDLPDYKNNPRIADREEIYGMLLRSYRR
jgi:alcohol dehydrogenase